MRGSTIKPVAFIGAFFALLSYGVYVPSSGLRAWQLACLRALSYAGNARLACILEEHAAPATHTKEAYTRFEDSLCVPAQKAATPDELSQLARDAVRIDAWQAPHCSVHWRADVQKMNLDFILLFGDPDPGLELADSTKFGVWTFLFGDLEKFIAQIPAFWEIHTGYEVTGATLVRLQNDGSLGIPLKRAALPTVRDSMERSLQNLLTTLPELPAQVANEITRGVAQYLDDQPLEIPARAFGYPAAWQIAVMRASQARSAAQVYVQNHFYTIDWNVFSVSGPPEQFIGKKTRAEMKSLYPYAKGTFFADPFVVTHNAQTYIFCEEYRYGEKRGLVVAAPLGEGKRAPLRPAIEEPYHLSYPHVFLYDGELYCIAESAGTRQVCLYQAIDFPNKWKQVRTLLSDFRAADATLLRAHGKWWLFCTGGEKGPKFGDDTHLYIFFSNELDGNWTPHACNPVKIDARSARPGGPFFSKDGVLYRPAQDCSRTYGGGISINRVDRLTETEFQETVVGSIAPPIVGYNKGIHTISAAGSWCIVDAKRYVFNPVVMRYVIGQCIRSASQRARLAFTERVKRRYSRVAAKEAYSSVPRVPRRQ